MTSSQLHRGLNALGLFAIICILSAALYIQLRFHELPCPLCLLQRVCFIAVGLTMLMNLVHSIRPAHYGLMLLSSFLGIATAGRQVLLHIAPGVDSYGRAIFSMHLYTWATLFFMLFSLVSAGLLLFERGFEAPAGSDIKRDVKMIKPGLRVLSTLFLGIIVLNIVLAFFECRLGQCPDNPVNYLLLLAGK